MRAEVARDLSDSAYDFMRVVWPAVQPVIGGRIEPVESNVSEGLGRDLDILGGIDAWQMFDGKGMRGIASRVQWGKNWRSFTVRTERQNGVRTEFEKRCYALDHPERRWLLPALTIHAYVEEPRRKGDLIEAAVVETAVLYEFARFYPCESLTNRDDGTLFKPWFWDEMLAAGVDVRVVS